MKASIKFPENSKPILKAKVPLNVLGLPFQSGIEAAGDAKDLSLSFSTLFQSGPLFKLLYRPNDSFKPFSFVVKTGLGHFGSPFAAPMTMSAEFNLLTNGSPAFSLHFRPQIGNFAVMKSVRSDSQPFLPLPDPSSMASSVPKFKDQASDSFSERVVSMSVDGGETPVKTVIEEGVFSAKVVDGYLGKRTAESLFSGMEVTARTVLPVRDRALVNFRWRMKFPAEMKSGPSGDEIRRYYRTGGGVPYGYMPWLALSKIGIEHVAASRGAQKSDDVAEACLAVKKELQFLQVERNYLRKSMDELRAAICGGKLAAVAGIQNSGKESKIENGKFFAAKRWKNEQKPPGNGGLPAKGTVGNVVSGPQI